MSLMVQKHDPLSSFFGKSKKLDLKPKEKHEEYIRSKRKKSDAFQTYKRNNDQHNFKTFKDAQKEFRKYHNNCAHFHSKQLVGDFKYL